MEIITTLFNEILYRPLLNALVFLYNIIPGQDFGIAIIVLTVIVRLVLYPLSQKAIKSQKALQQMQPKIKEIQEKHKEDKEAQTKAIMEFYKENKVNPFSGCFPLVIQLLLLIALYRVFLDPLQGNGINGLYSFVSHPGEIDFLFLGIIDLSQRSIFLAVLAGLFQFIQTKMIAPAKPSGKAKGDITSMMSRLTYFMPLITVFIALSFPAGLPLYWIVITLFTIAQQYFIMRKNHKAEQETQST